MLRHRSTLAILFALTSATWLPADDPPPLPPPTRSEAGDVANKQTAQEVLGDEPAPAQSEQPLIDAMLEELDGKDTALSELADPDVDTADGKVDPDEKVDADEDEDPDGDEDDLPDLDLPPLEEFASQPYLVDVPTVFSASLREERATEAPGTVIVIDKLEIRRRGYSQLIDVLRDVPGFETIENYFSEFGTQVPVRGISGNNKIVVLVDGMRVNPPGGENFPFRRDFSVRFAERVEIVYGSGSTLYGQDAISAVVNVVMKKPGDDGKTMEIGGEAGRNSERELWAWSSKKLCDEICITTFMQYHDSDLTKLDEEFPTYWQDYFNEANTKTNANGKGIRPDRNDYGLNLFGRIEGYDSSIQAWHRSSERSTAEGFNAGLGFLPQAQWGDHSTVVEAKNTLKLNKKKSLESIVTYNDYQIDRDSRYVFPANPSEWFLDDFKWGRGWSVEWEERYRVEPTKNFSFLAGTELRYSDIIPKSTFVGGFDPRLDPVSQGGFFSYTDGGGNPQTIPQVSQVTYWTFAAFMEAQYQMYERLRLVGGVRITTDERYDQVPVTPRAAAIFSVTERFTTKYMYTQAFVAPAPYFAFSTFDNGTLLATTNPDVAPETAETHEVNFTYYGDDFNLGLSAYYGTQSDLILVADQAAQQNIVEDSVTVPSGTRTLVQTANGGDSTRYGVDIFGNFKTDRTSSWISYSYVDFEQNNLGVVTGLPFISRHNGRWGTTWRATQHLFITPSLVIRSTPENVAGGALSRELHDPYEVNLYALYQRNQNMDIFLDFRNITDHHYALGGFTGDAIPQETFGGVVGLRLTY